MPRSVCTGIIMLENPNIMLLQIRYNNRLDNSVTSAECQRRDSTLSIERCVAYSWLSCRTLVSLAFHGKEPNFWLKRNLLLQDEVMRKWSSRGLVFRGLPDLGQSAMFLVCWNLFSSWLTVDSWRWKCRAMSFADMPAVSIPMALSRCPNVMEWRFDVDFQRLLTSFCA